MLRSLTSSKEANKSLCSNPSCIHNRRAIGVVWSMQRTLCGLCRASYSVGRGSHSEHPLENARSNVCLPSRQLENDDTRIDTIAQQLTYHKQHRLDVIARVGPNTTLTLSWTSVRSMSTIASR